MPKKKTYKGKLTSYREIEKKYPGLTEQIERKLSRGGGVLTYKKLAPELERELGNYTKSQRESLFEDFYTEDEDGKIISGLDRLTLGLSLPGLKDVIPKPPISLKEFSGQVPCLSKLEISILLLTWKGKSDKKIAQAVGKTEGNVRTIRARAKTRIEKMTSPKTALRKKSE